MKLIIRRAATPEEIDAAGALTAEAYRADRLVDPEDSYLDELLDARRRASEAILLLALVPRDPSAAGPTGKPDVVVGSITLAPHGTSYAEIAEPGELELRMLAVAPEARGKGIAEALMRAAVREAVVLGWNEVVLSTLDAMVAAQRLYVRLGWTRVPERDWGHVEIHLRVYTWRVAEAPGLRAERATWPPALVEEAEGFELGLSGGVTRRANCAVLTRGDWATVPADELERRLAAVEAAYRLEGLTPCVRVDGAPGTTAADRVLDARGYRDVSETFVLVRELDPAVAAPRLDAPTTADVAADVVVTDDPSAEWLGIWLADQPADRDTGRAILEGAPARYLTAYSDGRAVGVLRVCRAVVRETADVDRPAATEPLVWAALSCLTVVAEQRGRGLGGFLVARGLDEARALGATRAFSQVLVRNEAALTLHEHSGFVVAGVYRYAELAPSGSALEPDGDLLTGRGSP